jgi:hypothetical protein
MEKFVDTLFELMIGYGLSLTVAAMLASVVVESLRAGT